MAAASKAVERRALGVRLPHLPPCAPLAERQRLRASNPARWVRLPQGALECDRGSASGRPSGFEPEDEGSIPSPRAFFLWAVSRREAIAESSNGRMRRSDRLQTTASRRCPGACLENRWRSKTACGFERAPPGHHAKHGPGGRASAEAIWGHGPTGRRWFRNPEIRVRLPVTPLEKHSPVVQRPRRLAYTQETVVQLHPGLL